MASGQPTNDTYGINGKEARSSTQLDGSSRYVLLGAEHSGDDGNDQRPRANPITASFIFPAMSRVDARALTGMSRVSLSPMRPKCQAKKKTSAPSTADGSFDGKGGKGGKAGVSRAVLASQRRRKGAGNRSIQTRCRGRLRSVDRQRTRTTSPLRKAGRAVHAMLCSGS